MKYFLDWTDEHPEMAVLVCIVTAVLVPVLMIFIYEMTKLVLSCAA